MYRNLIHISSNVFAKLNIDKAKRMLSFSFPDITYTQRTILTIPDDQEGSYPFRNVLGVFYTDLPLEEVIQKIKAIEHSLGKRSRDKDLGKVVIGLDLIQYGEVILLDDYFDREHVQALLAELGEETR